MSSDHPTDAELGAALRDAASKTTFSPRSFLTFAGIAADDYQRTVLPSQHFTIKREGGHQYHAQLISEYVLEDELTSSIPDWASTLIGPGFKIEKWQWDDGVVVIRLLDAQGLVVGSKTL
jgi:hypothetical protein